MQLEARPPQKEELKICAQIMQDSFVFDEKMRAKLVAMWWELLTDGVALAGLVEDKARPLGSHIVGFGFSVFVTDKFADEARTNLPPYIAKQVFLRWQQSRSPILTKRQIKNANSTHGLNYLGLHMSWGETCVSHAKQPEVRDVLLKSLFGVLLGHQLKHFLKEVYGLEDVQRFSTFGTRIVNDYSEYFGSNQSLRPEPKRQPYLVGVTRDEALSPEKEGTHARDLFTYRSPRFYFSPTEQELLLLAMYGLTDTQLAEARRKTPATIKKQWSSIYSRISEIDSSFFPLAPLEYSDSNGRGPGKKNFLLNYIRSHPEELRPHLRPKDLDD